MKQTPLIYTGVGSREAPPEALSRVARLASALSAAGWILRTGGADGCDAAFLEWSREAGLFLPWPYFNRHKARQGVRVLEKPTREAYEIAAKHHPGWARLERNAQPFHARNVHQVLGADCKTPSAMVVCWTKDGADGTTIPTGQETGGTGQAIRIAVAHGVPVFNLARRRVDEVLVFAEDWAAGRRVA